MCIRVFFSVFRSVYKCIARFITGRSELETITLRSNNLGYVLISDIEAYLLRSRQLKGILPRLLNPPPGSQAADAFNEIVRVKRINRGRQDFERFRAILTNALEQIGSLGALNVQLESARQPYESKNPEHEKSLLKLWSLLKPDVPLSARISRDWTDIGFQGNDPATDFRGMGLLGLHNLVEFSARHPEQARAILQDCSQRSNWFFYAITSINLTADALRLTRERKINRFYYRRGPTMDTFFHLHATMYARFNEAWREDNPVNVMEFKRIHDEWLEETQQELERGSYHLL